ncbi:MAG: tRNA (adenosine(37)-N6)-dimethylallyltransferase MiaA [Bacteroidota bacterium]
MAYAKSLVVIVGPTAIGKTALAIQLAQLYRTEIISADSRQCFKEMEIGTAKPTSEELAAIPHHFINTNTVEELFSPGDFEEQALHSIKTLFQHNDVVIMVGGSGLYIDAVCNGLDVLPPTNLVIRNELNNKFTQYGITYLQEELKKTDPEYFDRVDQFNPQRMIRGLEFFLSTGMKLSSFLTNTKKTRPFDIIKIGLNTDRERLYARINSRVDTMMDKGLLKEVSALTIYRHLNALNTVGYSELFAYLDGSVKLEEAVDKIKQNTRRFAKRQLTWFRKDLQTAWFDPAQTDEIIDYLKNCFNPFKPEQ